MTPLTMTIYMHEAPPVACRVKEYEAYGYYAHDLIISLTNMLNNIIKCYNQQIPESVENDAFIYMNAVYDDCNNIINSMFRLSISNFTTNVDQISHKFTIALSSIGYIEDSQGIVMKDTLIFYAMADTRNKALQSIKKDNITIGTIAQLLFNIVDESLRATDVCCS